MLTVFESEATCRRMARRIPPEVVDQIITSLVPATGINGEQPKPVSPSQIYSDAELEAKKELLSYSAVCREWRGVARRFLFRTVALRCSEGRDPQVRRSRTLAGAMDYIDAHPGVVAHIHTLRLVMQVEYSRHHRGRTHKGNAGRCASSVFVTFLSRFLNLQDLQLLDVGIEWVGDPAFVMPPSQGIKVDQLHISHPSFSTLEVSYASQLPLILGLFGHVGKLAIYGVNSERFDLGPCPLVPAVNLQVDALELGFIVPIRPLVRSLENSLTFSGSQCTLMELKVCFAGGDWFLFTPLLQRAASSLHTLHLDLSVLWAKVADCEYEDWQGTNAVRNFLRSR